jgi:hypothetical protein
MTVALVLVFGWVLPRFIDYEEVCDALAQLDVWEVLALLVSGLLVCPPRG